VGEATLKAAVTPLNVTDVTPVNFVPLIATLVPTTPLVGVKPVIVGGLTTVKLFALVAVPPDVVTLMGPVVAAAGTVATIVVLELTVNVALPPLNATAVAPEKFVPLIVTELPAWPLCGEKPVIVGGLTTVKLLPLVPVPAAVVTLIGPVVAPAGTVAVIAVADATEKAALTPLNVTAVAPVKLVPLIDTEVPTGPNAGVKLVTVGALAAAPVVAVATLEY
jgi:hypothetical protein